MQDYSSPLFEPSTLFGSILEESYVGLAAPGCIKTAEVSYRLFGGPRALESGEVVINIAGFKSIFLILLEFLFF